MDEWRVVVLAVVLEQHLPVEAPLVAAALAELQLVEPVRREAGGQRTGIERRGVDIEVDEHRPSERRDLDRAQPEIGDVETVRRRRRRRRAPATRRGGTARRGTGTTEHGPCPHPLGEGRTAVAAHVEEGAQLAGLVVGTTSTGMRPGVGRQVRTGRGDVVGAYRPRPTWRNTAASSSAWCAASEYHAPGQRPRCSTAGRRGRYSRRSPPSRPLTDSVNQ